MSYGKHEQKVDPTEYRVPRNFKLLDELESAEKGKYGDVKKYGQDCNMVTLGLDGQDATFTHWNASIIPHQGGYVGDRIYSLKIKCGPGYPDDPPTFQFVQKVSIPCVSNKGIVNFSKIQNYNWHRQSYLFEALLEIRKQMKPNAVAQACAKIANGAKYPYM